MGLVGGVAVPLVLSGGYAAIVLSHWSSGQGGFDSLASVEQLFKSRWLLLAGWVHYLAFDLLVGAWQLRTARREGIPHLHLLPCLLATFLFGPAGYLLFQLLRAAHRGSVRSAAVKPEHLAPGPWTLRGLAGASEVQTPPEARRPDRGQPRRADCNREIVADRGGGAPFGPSRRSPRGLVWP